jgi:esterase/lipase
MTQTQLNLSKTPHDNSVKQVHENIKKMKNNNSHTFDSILECFSSPQQVVLSFKKAVKDVCSSADRRAPLECDSLVFCPETDRLMTRRSLWESILNELHYT